MCHCKDENFEEVTEVINSMVKKGCNPGALFLIPIFGLFMKRKDFNGAYWMYAKMKELKCKPSTVDLQYI